MSGASQGLEFRQSQNLVMTPQLRQAIEILQMNNLDLAGFLDEELSKNPFLEKEEEPPSRRQETPDPKESQPSSDDSDEITPSEYENAVMYGSGGNRTFDSGSDSSFEHNLTEEKNLRTHLEEQINIHFDNESDRRLALILSDMLDDAGFLREDPTDIATRLSCPEEKLENILKTLKQFDPSGIFARDISECFALQLKDRGRLNPQMKALLDNLEMLAKHELSKLANLCKVSKEELENMIAEIRTLNPKPAGDFDHFIVQTVIPDVIMKPRPKHEGGGWRVELNNDTLPRVLVNNSYYTEISGSLGDKEGKKYVDNCVNAASWLVRALEQRANTILKVAACIIEEQDGFFLYGIEYLRPMTLKDIAEKIEMHESTVSRVTNGKYMYTPRGIFELKFFFTSSVGGDTGMAHSSGSIKAKISTMIKAETADNILSDDQIVESLKEDGIDIARRTVAKYRDALGIPSSVQRKRQKRI